MVEGDGQRRPGRPAVGGRVVALDHGRRPGRREAADHPHPAVGHGRGHLLAGGGRRGPVAATSAAGRATSWWAPEPARWSSAPERPSSWAERRPGARLVAARRRQQEQDDEPAHRVNGTDRGGTSLVRLMGTGAVEVVVAGWDGPPASLVARLLDLGIDVVVPDGAGPTGEDLADWARTNLLGPGAPEGAVVVAADVAALEAIAAAVDDFPVPVADRSWRIDVDRSDPEREPEVESWLTVGNGRTGTARLAGGPPAPVRARASTSPACSAATPTSRPVRSWSGGRSGPLSTSTCRPPIAPSTCARASCSARRPGSSRPGTRRSTTGSCSSSSPTVRRRARFPCRR